MEETLVFPVHLFTCPTLTNFRLCMNHNFKIPSFIHFESLRSLTLVEIIFPDSSSTQQLFSGCPSVEELTLDCCSWVNVKAVCISSPVLQKLIIKERDEEDYDKSDEGYDIGGLNVSNCCHVVIVGTNLKSFSYEGDFKNDYFLYSSTSVIDASVEINAPDIYSWSEDWEKEVGYLASKLLKELSNVEKLSISELAISALSSTTSLLGHLPLFCNLAELRVVSLSLSPIELSCEALLTILRKSPCLQVVEFEGGVCLPNDSANNNYILDPLPMCFRENLKTIKIDAFSGWYDDEQLHAIKMLLQEASVLETLLIDCSSYGLVSPTRLKRLKKSFKQIVMFPKGSTDCEIVLKYMAEVLPSGSFQIQRLHKRSYSEMEAQSFSTVEGSL